MKTLLKRLIEYLPTLDIDVENDGDLCNDSFELIISHRGCVYSLQGWKDSDGINLDISLTGVIYKGKKFSCCDIDFGSVNEGQCYDNLDDITQINDLLEDTFSHEMKKKVAEVFRLLESIHEDYDDFQIETIYDLFWKFRN